MLWERHDSECGGGGHELGVQAASRSQKRQENGIPSWSRQKDHPCLHLDLSPVRPVLGSDLQNCKRRDVCCFKP